MDDVPPLFPNATEPGALCWVILPSLFILGGLAGLLYRSGLGNTLVECDILGVYNLVLASLFGKRGVMMVCMLMLVCRIQHGIRRDF